MMSEASAGRIQKLGVTQRLGVGSSEGLSHMWLAAVLAVAWDHDRNPVSQLEHLLVASPRGLAWASSLYGGLRVVELLTRQFRALRASVPAGDMESTCLRSHTVALLPRSAGYKQVTSPPPPPPSSIHRKGC